MTASALITCAQRKLSGMSQEFFRSAWWPLGSSPNESQVKEGSNWMSKIVLEECYSSQNLCEILGLNSSEKQAG